jgi:predicted nucleic acid-binding protein
LRADLARSLRRIRPERFNGLLLRRDDADLDFVHDAPLVGAPLLLDTCVYIDGLEGSLPPPVETLLQARSLMHLSVVLGELSHNFGRLDPRHPRTRDYLGELAGTIGDIPRHRLDDGVSAGVLLEAGILAGLVFRLGGFQPGQEVAALNDATIYLHALERGYTVLTRNIRDFDFMSQIVPSGRVLFYRTA